MGDWQTYTDQVINKFDYDTNEWTKMNVCSGAIICDHTGSIWAQSGTAALEPACNVTVATMEGEKQETVNEGVCAMKAAEGSRNVPGSDAGIRLNGGVKHQLNFYDDAYKTSILVSPYGGASVGLANTCLVIGYWRKDQKNSLDKPQNKDECFNMVKDMTAYLIEQGM